MLLEIMFRIILQQQIYRIITRKCIPILIFQIIYCIIYQVACLWHRNSTGIILCHIYERERPFVNNEKGFDFLFSCQGVGCDMHPIHLSTF